MFLTLLLVTFLTAAIVAFICVQLFKAPIASILDRIIADEISHAWAKYLKFAIYVVGIGGGVRVYSLERFIIPRGGDTEPLVLTRDRWVLEIYRTVIDSLSSIAWMLLVLFVFALVAYVVVKIFGARGEREGSS